MIDYTEIKLNLQQRELLKRLATHGYDIVLDDELPRARGLYHRKISLLVVEIDEEASDREAHDIRWVAHLTEHGARWIEENVGWRMQKDRDGSYMHATPPGAIFPLLVGNEGSGLP